MSAEISMWSTLGSSAVTDRRYNKWLNRFAWLTCVATLLLICSGGMVTSKNVGLAVPDWPTTFGYNMFLFPVSKWVGGILFEHTHRLMGSLVGFLTIILAIACKSGDRFTKIFANQNVRGGDHDCDLRSVGARSHDAPPASGLVDSGFSHGKWRVDSRHERGGVGEN